MRWFLGCCLLLLVGCGQTTLIDPDAAVRSRINVLTATQFTVSGDAREYLQVRLSPEAAGLDAAWAENYVLKAIAPGRTVILARNNEQRVDCDGFWCLLLVMAPGSLPAGFVEFELEVPTLKHRQRLPLERISATAWGLQVEPFDDNTKVLVTAQDPLLIATRLSFHGSARELLVAPGVCSDSPAADDPRWTLTQTFPAELEPNFSDAVQMCVWMRPPLPAQGSAVAAVSVSGKAVIRTYQHTFAPEPQRAPIVFGFLFDLEIPDPVRCRTAQDKLRSKMRKTAESEAEGAGFAVEVYELEPVQIAEDQGVLCRQGDQRDFDGRATRDAAQAELQQHFGNTPIRISWIYVNNLDLPLPRSVSDGLSDLTGGIVIGEQTIPGFLSAVVADVPLADLSPDNSLRWVSADDPVFLQAVSILAASMWPFITLDHDPEAHVPLLTPEAAAEVKAFRLCATPAVKASGIPINAETFQPGPLGPGFTASLLRRILVPENTFIAEVVEIRWQACLGLCERSGPGQPNSLSWLESLGCP